MKRQIAVALGLALISTPAFAGKIIVIDDEPFRPDPWKCPPFTIPEPMKPITPPQENEFIKRKIAELRRRRK